ncbi:hypothetical protein STAQ_34960 [Allostella sp. ATCC 35155]|nr:hypothetical protein STAQ_34960 [Stella sp. ATCC 35155]
MIVACRRILAAVAILSLAAPAAAQSLGQRIARDLCNYDLPVGQMVVTATEAEQFRAMAPGTRETYRATGGSSPSPIQQFERLPDETYQCYFEKRWTRGSFEERLTATAPITLTGSVALYTLQLGAWLSQRQ